jgi:putative ABC transport system permease protein
MLKNYLKVALRNLVRNKAHSFINITGLSVGMAVAVLIGLWVWDELAFNQYHKNYPRIAQVMRHATYDGEKGTAKYLPYPLTVVLKNNYHNHFKHLLTARQPEEFHLSSGEIKISKKGQFIDDGAPEMLSLSMQSGSWKGLKELHSIMISASTAKALFGDADPMNKTVNLNNRTDVKVSGVYEDLPKNSDFYGVQFFCPFALDVATNKWISEQSWDNQFLFMYAEIAGNTSFEKASAAIKDAELKVIEHLSQYKEQADRKPANFLHPMSKWHLYSEFKDWVAERGPIRFVWLIGIIGAFVLLLACINFMNLSTARSEKRAKEVGIRKTIGSLRSQLIGQFYSESLLVVLVAFGIALVLAAIALPWFNNLAAKQMTMPWSNIWFWIFGAIFISVTALLSGSYPALYLSSFKPVKVLKGSFRVGRLAALPRKTLVVVQFTISIALIICTMIIYNQIIFAKNRPVGYSREGLMLIEKKSAEFYGKQQLLKQELLNTGVVTNVAESGGSITNVWQWNGGFTWKGQAPGFDPSFGTLPVSSEYGNTVGWQFVAGRDFSPQLTSDSSAIILNESALKVMGLQNPLGELVTWETDWRKPRTYKVIGVIKDMVMESPFENIVPTIFRLEPGFRWMHIKMNPQVSAGEALPKIEAVFKKLIPSAPFDYKFADEEYALKFAAEERIGNLAWFFAVLAILISCLGLFGLASFVAEQRTKEIGVRKVLGASVPMLWRLLTKDFVRLVIISLFIAIPVAYYFMSGWLQNYQYRAEMSWWIFAGAGAGALLITLITVSYQAIKAAITNPVKSLRTE